MVRQGNSEPERCAQNLLRITRGEVPYDRIRGIDGHIIDSPAVAVVPEFKDDATWMLNTYEPRVEVDSVTVDADSKTGEFKLSANFK